MPLLVLPSDLYHLKIHFHYFNLGIAVIRDVEIHITLTFISYVSYSCICDFLSSRFLCACSPVYGFQYIAKPFFCLLSQIDN